jgi:tRNA(Ile)-lysidine synthase
MKSFDQGHLPYAEGREASAGGGMGPHALSRADREQLSPHAWRVGADTALTDRLTSGASNPVCVAFSGGSDSLALLHLAEAWGRRAGRPIVALTVDHGLNPQSADWTAAAAAVAARLGVGWRGLVWSGDKPTRGLPAAARDARHALLADATRDLGASVILFAHTADDVAESALIRADTPGHGHLRPWSPSPAWPQGRGVFLLRPLLAARRADLRAWLSAQTLGWLEDPANADPRFARSRARVDLAEGRAGVGAGVALADADACVQRLARQVLTTADGRLIVSRKALTLAPDVAVRRVVSAALVCTGGRARPPRGESLTRLLGAVAAGEDVASTLSGARVVAVKGQDAIGFGRDAGERARGGLASLRLQAGETGVFDGRFDVQARSAPVQVVALVGLISDLDRVDRLRLRAIPAWSRGALPAVIDAGGVVRLPAPFGDGPAVVRSLVGQRFGAACALVNREVDLAASLDMAL